MKHLIQPGETVQSLAVRHGCDLASIKRLNNIITDNSLSSRHCIYVPAFKDLADLTGHGVRYEYDAVSKRGYAVVFDILGPGKESESIESAAGPAEPDELQKKLWTERDSSKSREVRDAVVTRLVHSPFFSRDICNNNNNGTHAGFDDENEHSSV